MLPVSKSLTVAVNQKGASAGRNLVGGDMVTYNFAPPGIVSSNTIVRLSDRLKKEVELSEEIKSTVENLKYYYTRHAPDGIDGVEAKLEKAGRQDELYMALTRKEQFAKLLEKWSLYASAQEIIAYLLAKVETGFTLLVQPHIGQLDDAGINKIVLEQIIVPTVEECECDVIPLNNGLVLGMVYWLAEQCFVRWHKL